MIKKTNPIITPFRAQDKKTRGEGVSIARYKDVRYPARTILLKEDISGDVGNRVDAALRTSIDCALRCKMLEANAVERDFELDKYCRCTWLVRLASEPVANLLAGKTINIQGHNSEMESFHRILSQVYVCNSLSMRIGCSKLLKELDHAVSKFSQQQAHKVYVMKSRPSLTQDQNERVVVYAILDRPSNVASITFTERCALHFTAWSCEDECQLCGDGHSLLDCRKFAPLSVREEKLTPKQRERRKPTPLALTNKRPEIKRRPRAQLDLYTRQCGRN